MAAAHGRSHATQVVSEPDDVTLRAESVPGLRVTKTLDDSRTYRVGDRVTYTYTVTGDRELTGVGVTDDRIDDVTCEATILGPAGEGDDSTTCTGTYVVTRADVRRGSVTNVAVATAENGTVRSEPDRARITVSKKQPCHSNYDKPCKPKPKPKPTHKPKPKPKPCREYGSCRST
ncbi:DUF7507 domain-containing protein [Streptomyces antibioticus]|uniref:DUF7507 domain-containing protein n=1 Tax=Streptomyces antibioticus TaxID=1890 RepID=UPI0033F03C5F